MRSRLIFVAAIALGAVGCIHSKPLQETEEDPTFEQSGTVAEPFPEPEVPEEVPVEAEAASLSDSPYDPDAFQDVIRIGGGAGGKFGGRQSKAKKVYERAGSAVLAPSELERPQVAIHGFQSPERHHLSTFALDVDTAAYANVRGYLNKGSLPPDHAVRLEELINYFRYDDPRPHGGDPIAIQAEVADCPWQPQHKLVRIALSSQEISFQGTAPSNLVFLIDTSGSMNNRDKLPLLQDGLRMLVEELRDDDRVAIVTYAGSSGLALPSTPARERTRILHTLENLRTRGGTNGAAGIRLAYQVARENFVPGAVNRVILATDGDFNVGISKPDVLKALIQEEAASGVYVSVLGFGGIHSSDQRLETLADHGNGNYTYIDSKKEARRALVEEMGATLVTVAKDVKIQVEFNADQVLAWRQLGYENRQLASEDFRDDAKDAGEMGAGHTISALYEIVPIGVNFAGFSEEVSPVETDTAPRVVFASPDELLRVRLRWKDPDASTEDSAHEREIGLTDRYAPWLAASDSFRFAASVALFGMVLRRSPHCGEGTLTLAEELGRSGQGDDLMGYRQEFLGLVARARDLGI